jgi:hypothetical protein
MTYLFSLIRKLKQFYSLIKFSMSIGFSIETIVEQGNSTTQIKLERLQTLIRFTDKGDLTIAVPRGIIISGSVILFDTDGIDRLPYTEQALANEGLYIGHPEESEEINEASSKIRR